MLPVVTSRGSPSFWRLKLRKRKEALLLLQNYCTTSTSSSSSLKRQRRSRQLTTSALFAQFKASSILKCSVGAHSQLVWNRQRRDICPIYSCILYPVPFDGKNQDFASYRLDFRFRYFRYTTISHSANRNNSSNQSVIE